MVEDSCMGLMLLLEVLSVGDLHGRDSGNECGFAFAAVSRRGSPQSDCKNYTTWSQSDTSGMLEAKEKASKNEGEVQYLVHHCPLPKNLFTN